MGACVCWRVPERPTSQCSPRQPQVHHCYRLPHLASRLPALKDLVVYGHLYPQRLPPGLTSLHVTDRLNADMWDSRNVAACSSLQSLTGRGPLPHTCDCFPRLTSLTWTADSQPDETALCKLLEQLRGRRVWLYLTLHSCTAAGFLACSGLTLSRLQIECRIAELHAWPAGLAVTHLVLSCAYAPGLLPLPSSCSRAEITVARSGPIVLHRAELESRGLQTFKLTVLLQTGYRWPSLLLHGSFQVESGQWRLRRGAICRLRP